MEPENAINVVDESKEHVPEAIEEQLEKFRNYESAIFEDTEQYMYEVVRVDAIAKCVAVFPLVCVVENGICFFERDIDTKRPRFMMFESLTESNMAVTKFQEGKFRLDKTSHIPFKTEIAVLEQQPKRKTKRSNKGVIEEEQGNEKLQKTSTEEKQQPITDLTAEDSKVEVAD